MVPVHDHPVTHGRHDDPSPPDDDLMRQRAEWFAAYTAQKNVLAPVRDSPYTCPCCGHPDLAERGVYEICGECGWEDDGQDDHDSAVIRGGPNGHMSLDAARAEYARTGGTAQAHVPPSEPI